MSVKRASQGMVAHSFSHATIANAAVGEPVCITTDFTVDSVAGRPIGTIASINKNTGKVVVELFSDRMMEVKAGGTITAGDYVKLSARNTVLTSTALLADAPLSFGVALQSGVINDIITIVPLR